MTAPPRPEALLADMVTATHILIAEGVLDVFGHIAVRDPDRADVFWHPRAVAPARLCAEDILPFSFDGQPLVAADTPLYSERVLHCALLADPSKGASLHYHAASLMPYCMGGRALVAISQTGAWIGEQVPLWDSRTAFGDTPMLVTDHAQAQDIATALGPGHLALMRGHGAVVTFRAIHAAREADTLTKAAALGPVTPLSPGEIALAGSFSPAAVARGWDHWTALHTGGAEGPET